MYMASGQFHGYKGNAMFLNQCSLDLKPEPFVNRHGKRRGVHCKSIDISAFKCSGFGVRPQKRTDTAAVKFGRIRSARPHRSVVTAVI